MNVTVAWACAYMWRQIIAITAPMGHPVSQLFPSRWRIAVPPDWPAQPAEELAMGSAWYTMGTQQTLRDHTSYVLHEFRFGFPMKSLSCYRVDSGMGATWSQSWSYAAPFARSGSYPLPTRLLWSGFLLNSVVYALFLWLPLAGFVVARRALRLRRGLCPECAYPLGASPICTECGARQAAGPLVARGRIVSHPGGRRLLGSP